MRNSLLILATICILSACQKDSSTPSKPKPDPVRQDTCLPTLISFSTDFDLSDVLPWTKAISYSGKKLSGIERNPGSDKFLFSYNSGYPVRVDRPNSGTNTFDSILYDGSMRIISVKHYSNGLLSDTKDYQYNNGQRTKIIFTYYGSTISVSNNVYSYNNNLLQKVERFDTNGNLYDSYTYAYSNVANKLFVENNLIDIYFHYDEDMESVVYDGLLNNSFLISSISYTEGSNPPQTFAITYDMNSQGYPTKVNSNNSQIIAIQYQCN